MRMHVLRSEWTFLDRAARVQGMEDLVVHYDYSVRMSDGRVVQFRYGDDALDPIDMEGEEKPIDFDKAMSYVLVCG
jgi:DNA-directed RNA polymerase III subunit RPC1